MILPVSAVDFAPTNYCEAMTFGEIPFSSEYFAGVRPCAGFWWI
jgi:hypothetical protein